MGNKPVHLNSRSFGSQQEALNYVKDNILDHYNLEDIVSDSGHIELLRELVERRDNAEEKIGPGIKEFFIRDTRTGGRSFSREELRGIYIRRVDGSEVDWSYKKAIERPGHKANVKEALRLEVEDKRLEFREQAFVTGQPVHSVLPPHVLLERREDTEVVYLEPPWPELVEGFVDTQGGWANVKTDSGGGKTQIGRHLTADAVRDAWRQYYDEHAEPRLAQKGEGARRPRV